MHDQLEFIVLAPLFGVFGALSAEVPFPTLGQSPPAWSAQLRVQIQGVVPEQANRAYDFTKFEIISGTAPKYGTLQVNTTPSAAELYVDGLYRSGTPRSIVLTARSPTTSGTSTATGSRTERGGRRRGSTPFRERRSPGLRSRTTGARSARPC